MEEGTSPFDSEVLVQEVSRDSPFMLLLQLVTVFPYVYNYVQMANLLENAGFRDPVVSLTSLISISNGAVLLFEILLTFPTDQDTLETFNNNINNGLMMMGFGRFSVDENAPIGVVSVSSAGVLSFDSNQSVFRIVYVNYIAGEAGSHNHMQYCLL